MSAWIGLIGVVVGGLLAMLGPQLMAWRSGRARRLEVFLGAAIEFAALEDRSRSIIWEAKHLDSPTDDLRWSRSNYNLVYTWLKVNSPTGALREEMEKVQDAGRAFQRVWRGVLPEGCHDHQKAFDHAEQAHRDAIEDYICAVRRHAEEQATLRTPSAPTPLTGVPPR